MIKPQKLEKGDKVATISLSWGGAGDIPHRYAAGKKQIEETFGLNVIETKHALKSADWIYKNPKARAEDLMEALEDKSIKAIFSNIGGEDSLRILPYLDIDTIKKNPKIFIGFSDTTVTHFAFYKAGVTSFYGPSVLLGFAENCGMHQYLIDSINNALFSSSPVGIVKPNEQGWTSERLEWTDPENQGIKRKLEPSTGWRFLQGDKIVAGNLLGGCVEVFQYLNGTDYWVKAEGWKDKIMFIETSEVMMPPASFRWFIRNLGAQGILQNINGLIMGRPYDNKYAEQYDKSLLQVVQDELGLTQLPIITGMDFGHIMPVFTIPYGVMAEINPVQKTFSITEGGVI
ncbi:MAG TPA: S66 peptidase family protein [Bacteroidia bacterium]|jgi:muramoyltetrapeptide carboxypeptidase LdcA involved in peptidoglycan recycling|nr:S66 peptidase family protein [Bacteroidia bacterium]